MMFWMQELQARRREFSRLQSSHGGGNVQKQRSASSIGLIASDSTFASTEDEPGGFNKIVEKPSTVGDQAAIPKGEAGWNFSFTKMNKEFRNWRKSTAITGDPLFQDLQEDGKNVTDGKPCEKLIDIDDSNNTKEERKIDFGFSRLASSIRSKIPVPPLSPTISSPLILDENTTCQECIETRSMLSVLKEAITVAEKEISTRDDVIQSLHEQLHFASYKTNRSEDEETSAEYEQYIQQLSRMVKNLNSEIERLKIQVKEKEQSQEESTEQIKVLREMIQAKDNSIIELTNRLWKIEQPAPCLGVLEEAEEVSNLRIANNEDMEYGQLKVGSLE